MDVLTPTGRVVAALAVALAIGGLLTGYRGVCAVGVAGGAVVVAGWLSVRRANDLDVRRAVLPERVQRGQVARVRIELRNRRAVATRPLSVVDSRKHHSDTTLEIGAISGGESTSVEYSVDCTRRGRIKIGPLLLRQADPFGVCSADATSGAPSFLWVYPATHRIEVLPQGRVKDLEGPTSDTAPNGSASFHQLREYVPGDDLRHIHWRTTARTGTLMVKHLVDTTKPEIAVLLDNRADVLGAEDFEEAVEVAASLVTAAQAGHYPVHLSFSAMPPDARELASAPHLDRLATAERADAPDFVGAAQELRGRRGPVLIVVTGELRAADLQAVSKLGRSFVTTILVSTVARREAPFVVPPGCWALTVPDARTFAEQWRGR
ncbi:MAG: DUF58 domain-containing protein [Actinomycetota bacterium]